MDGYVPERSAPVIVQNRDALEALAGMARARGSILFSANATDTKVLVLYGSTFEFLDDVSGVGAGNIAVQIGASAEATRDNLITALDELPEERGVTKVTGTASGTDTILLEHYDVGTAGNVTIITDDVNITVAGMAGGRNGNDRFVSYVQTGSGALAVTLAPGVKWKLHDVRLTLGASCNTGTFSGILDHENGAVYDHVIFSHDLSAQAIQFLNFSDWSFTPMVFTEGTELDLAWANGTGATWGVEIVWENLNCG